MRGKKLVALLLALGTCFAVAACDDDQSTNTPDSGNTSVSSSASAGDSSNSSSSNGSSDSSSSNSSSTTPAVETTVTATEWADALDMTGATNYTIDAVTVVGESTESLHFAEFDGKTVHVIENNSTETFYYKESNNYFKIEGGVKKTSTQDEYVSATKQTAGFSAHLAFNQFTYDETDKAYKADSIYVREEEQYSNLVFKFENGKLVYYSVVVATQWGPVHTTATFTYGETETIQLPTVA